MRYLADSEVIERLSWDRVLEALSDAFRAKESFRAPDRVAIEAPQGGAFLTMPCADGDGYFGVKQVAVLPDNPARGIPSVQAHYTLFDDSGRPALSCAATILTRIRTSAVSALAAERLAPYTARSLLVVGTGSLAPWMVEAHMQTRDYERVQVWGRSQEKAEALARELEDRFTRLSERPSVSLAVDLEEAVRAAEVISVATTSREPLLRGAWLREHHHLDLVGAFVPTMAEADAEAVKACDVYVDDRSAARHEAGDLIQALESGWSFDQVRGDLSEVIARPPSRSGRPTMFKSVGLSLEDLAVARLLV